MSDYVNYNEDGTTDSYDDDYQDGSDAGDYGEPDDDFDEDDEDEDEDSDEDDDDEW